MSEYGMRAPCRDCKSSNGTIERKGFQDCVYCMKCGAFQYNAPRTETGERPVSTQTVHKAIKPKQRARVLGRAGARCELCHKRDELHVGHIVSVDAGLRFGMTERELNDDENLTALCPECNLGQGAEPISLPLARAIVRARISWRELQ